MTGFVSFVGAGPGDPLLTTLAAVERLRLADVVMFDELIAPEVLAHARPGAELLPVGKRAGRSSPTQSEVNRLLVARALNGGRVVRLKSGDPGIFGRLEEEILALRAAAIPFEIVPGVSAASAAAAAAGIPLTRRQAARRVQYVTGHDLTGTLPEDLNWAALADPEATTVVFMPRRTFAQLAARLLAAGLPPETPALFAESVGHADQRLVRSTVAALADLIGGIGGDGPTLILYGALAESDP